jgi:hypothetical protein
MDILVISLLAWITARTGLDADPPLIVQMDRQSMHRVYYESDPPPQTALKLQAFYYHPTASVVLPTDWTGHDLGDQSVLLHELVHHVQRTNDVRGVPCELALERQAYDLQVEWLEEQGVDDPYELIEADAFTITFLTACMQD